MNLKSSQKETLIAYLFLLPNFLGFLIFTSLPVLASLILAFLKWDMISPDSTIKFIGLANFIKLLGFHMEGGSLRANDPFFWKYLYNTVFLMMGIPLGMAGSLVLALAMNQKIKGIVFFRTIYFLPTMCSGVAIALLWKWMFNYDFGLLNSFIRSLGDLLHLRLEGIKWLTSEKWAKPSIILMGFWTYVGGMNMILYLAGLQNIPRDLYEAADIDGASGWQKFWAVTWPMISPTTFFIAIMSVIGGFQGGFMIAYILTRGGPNGATTTLAYYIFNNLYVWQRMGYASAIAWFLFVVIFIVTLFNWRFGGKLVHY
jgi:multiple sugar transport system permease protein